MTYACPDWELTADTYLLKLQRLQNKVLRTIGNVPRCTLVRELRTALILPHVCDYIRQFCRRQAEGGMCTYLKICQDYTCNVCVLSL
jgi:hypothetical protein